MPQDIFADAAQWWQKRGQRDTAAAVTQKEIAQANRYRSDKTVADEMRVVFYLILIAATAVTVFLGYNYYLTVFTPISPDWGWLLAAVLSLITEIGKCSLLLYTFYSIFFRWWRKWLPAMFYFMGLALAACTYIWSIHISTRGAEEYAIEQAQKTVPRDSLPKVIAAATADLDRQITAENNARDAANSTKWKGTTTVQAQKNAGTSSRTLETLQTQRAAIVAQITEEYRTGLLQRSDKINHLATFVRRSGGWLEFATFLSILALALSTVNLVNTRREEQTTDNQQPATNFP